MNNRIEFKYRNIKCLAEVYQGEGFYLFSCFALGILDMTNIGELTEEIDLKLDTKSGELWKYRNVSCIKDAKGFSCPAADVWNLASKAELEQAIDAVMDALRLKD